MTTLGEVEAMVVLRGSGGVEKEAIVTMEVVSELTAGVASCRCRSRLLLSVVC